MAVIEVPLVHGISFPRFPRRFHWSAALNSVDGVAESFESSDISGLLSSDDMDGSDVGGEGDVLSLGDAMFGSYPQWLVTWPVTFGLLRARSVGSFEEARYVRAEKKAKGLRTTKDSTAPMAPPFGVSICDTLFGLNLLTFKRPTTNIVRGSAGTSERRLVVDLPIIGGLMAYMPQKNGGVNADYCGCIRLTLVQQKRGGGKGKEGGQFSRKMWQSIAIESEIADGYRPAIAGAAPVCLARKWVYRSTQSLVHAYVMWRFHDRCASYLVSHACHPKN